MSCQCWLCNLDDDERMEYEYSRYARGCRDYNVKPLDIDIWFRVIAHDGTVSKVGK